MTPTASESIEELLGRSSLGTRGVRMLASHTPRWLVAEILSNVLPPSGNPTARFGATAE